MIGAVRTVTLSASVQAENQEGKGGWARRSQAHKPASVGGWARRSQANKPQAFRRQAVRGSTSVGCVPRPGPSTASRGDRTIDRGSIYSHKVLWSEKRYLRAG